MKRIIGISITALLLVIFFIGVNGYGTLNINSLFYDNMSGITISVDADILGDSSVLEHFIYISEHYNIYVAKYISRNETTMSVYSTDTTLDGKIELKTGRYPANENEYVISGEWDNTQPTGLFYCFKSDAKIVVYPMDSLAKLGGFGGLFHINTTDVETAHNIVDYLNSHVGQTELFHVYNTSVISTLIPLLETSAESDFVLFLFGLVCGFIYLLTIIRYAAAQSRTTAILQVNGFSLRKTMGYHIRQLSGVLGFSFCISVLMIAAYILIKHGAYYLSNFIAVNILCFFGLVLFLFTVLAVAIFIQITAYNKVQVINRATPFRLLATVQLVLKYGIYVFILFSLVLIQQYQNDLAHNRTKEEVWQQAQDVYAVMSRYITDDMIVRRDYELRAYEVYKDWEEHLDGFLIRADNYLELSDGYHAYDANAGSGHSLYSPNGLSITVNENYLRRHTVVSAENGTDVLSQIIHEPFVENVLVPVSLRRYEDEIYCNFLNGFAFQKIEIANMYSSELGVAGVPFTKDDLKINIIYVEDGMKYFTYDTSIEADNQNQVNDPIVIVDIGNVDYSYYLSYLTNSCFYETDNIEPLAELMPYVAKHQMQSVYDNVYSMYSVRAEVIQDTMKKLQNTIVVEILLIIGFILSIYLYNACYFEKNKYIFCIKRLHGYGFFKLSSKMILLNFLLSFVILLPFDITPYFKIALLSLDMLFVIVFGSYIGQKSSIKTIKGEH